MTIDGFFAACLNGNTSHSIGHVHLNHHRGGIFVPLQTVILRDVDDLGLYNVILLAVFDWVLCFLPLRRSQEIKWSRYGVDDQPFFGYGSTTR